MSSYVPADSEHVPRAPDTPEDHDYEDLDEDFAPRPAPDNVKFPAMRKAPDLPAGGPYIVLKIPTRCPDAVRRNGRDILLALALLLSVITMATTVGLFMASDSGIKELREELRETRGESAALKVEVDRLKNLLSSEREF